MGTIGRYLPSLQVVQISIRLMNDCARCNHIDNGEQCWDRLFEQMAHLPLRHLHVRYRRADGQPVSTHITNQNLNVRVQYDVIGLLTIASAM